MLYPWLVFLHVIGVFGFLLAHGASSTIGFALRRERNIEHIRALLNLSRSTVSVMFLSLILLLLTGIITGFIGQWWSWGWIWTALGLLVVLFGAMGVMGTRPYNELRVAVGVPSFYETNEDAAVDEPLSAEEIDALLMQQPSPIVLTAIGFGGIIIIAWLMMFKPF